MTFKSLICCARPAKMTLVWWEELETKEEEIEGC